MRDFGQPNDFGLAPTLGNSSIDRQRLYEFVVTNQKWWLTGVFCDLGVSTAVANMSMTVAEGLKTALPDAYETSSLTMHVIGAATYEIARMVVFEDTMHLCPALISRRLV